MDCIKCGNNVVMISEMWEDCYFEDGILYGNGYEGSDFIKLECAGCNYVWNNQKEYLDDVSKVLKERINNGDDIEEFREDYEEYFGEGSYERFIISELSGI